MLPLEGKWLELFTQNKLLTRLPILLAQIRAANNLYKLRNEIKQILFLLYRHKKFTKKVYDNLMKSLETPKRFACFNFDWSRDVDENLNHEIEFTVSREEKKKWGWAIIIKI